MLKALIHYLLVVLTAVAMTTFVISLNAACSYGYLSIFNYLWSLK